MESLRLIGVYSTITVGADNIRPQPYRMDSTHIHRKYSKPERFGRILSAPTVRNVSGGYYPPLRWKRNVFENFKHQFIARVGSRLWVFAQEEGRGLVGGRAAADVFDPGKVKENAAAVPTEGGEAGDL